MISVFCFKGTTLGLFATDTGTWDQKVVIIWRTRYRIYISTQIGNMTLQIIITVYFFFLLSDPKYGAGIYFTKNLAFQGKKASATDKLIYVFEAEVLTGSFCQGHQEDIIPPPLSPGAIDRHDSVVDNVSSPEIFVIFSSVQAMPQYLWTCTQSPVWPKEHSSKSMMLAPQSNWGKFSRGSPVDLPPFHFNN